MNSRSFTLPRPSGLLAAAAVAGLFVSGCTTGNYDDSRERRGSLANETEDGVTLRNADSAAKASVQNAGEDGSVEEGSPIPGARLISMAFPTGERATSAIMLEKEVPGEVILNNEFEYRIRVQNLTDRALDSVRVTDSIPPGFEVTSTEPVGQVLGNSSSWDLGSLAPRSAKTLTVRGRATQMGEITACASVDYESSLCSTTTVVSPALEVVLELPEQALACDPFETVVRVTNAGTGDARDVQVINELPEGLTTPQGQRRVVLNFGTLGSAQSKEREIRLKASNAGSFTQTARAEGAAGLASSSAPATIRLVEPELALTMNARERVLATQAYETTLRIENTGDGPSEDTIVRVKLPRNSEVLSSTGDAEQSSTGLTWKLGTLEPGEGRDLSYESKGTLNGTLVTEAKATGRCADERTATARTDVRGKAALKLELTDESDLILVGDSVTYKIEVMNQGSAPDNDIVLTCTVEEGVEILSTGGAVEGTIDGRTVTFAPIASLAPGEEVEVQVTVKSSREFDSRFGVSMTSAELERPVEENESTNFVK